MYTQVRRHAFLVAVFFCLTCAAAAAQTISGVVTDASGGVLPGVAVEAQNPATGQVRTAVSDGSGRYVITALQPGTYSVTFTLDSFTPATRPGIALTSGFTANVDMQLVVGAQSDRITVTADAPLVDVESAATQTTVDREVLDTLPSGRSPESVGVLIPGVTLRAAGSGSISRDVGGSSMMNQSPLQFRGTNDTVQVLNGMRRVYLRPGPEFNGAYVNDGAVQEMTFGQGAEAMDMGQSGLRVNIVPKSGGNVMHGAMFAAYTGEAFESEMNIDDRLRSLGFSNPTGLVKLFDFNPSINGPLKEDRLWFSLAYRSWGVTNTVAINYNEATDRQSYRPGSQPAEDPGRIWDVTGRLSWQATSADNVSFIVQEQKRTRDYFSISATTSPEGASVNTFPTSTYQIRWTRVQSASLLFDGAFQYYDMQNQVRIRDEALRDTWCYENIMVPKTTPVPYYRITEQTLGISYNANAACTNDATFNHQYLGTVTHIRGAHEMKVGGSFFRAESYNPSQPFGYASYTYRNGSPVQATLSIPRPQVDTVKADIGLWAQDRWRLDRLTLNYGVRLDMIRTGWPEQVLPANPYTPEFRFEARDTFVNWKDISPRVGAAYDLFGSGRTALKASVARYVAAETIGLNSLGNPMSALSTSVNRQWSDLNNDRTVFNPDFSLQLNELGPSTNQNFGRSVQTTTVNPEILDGWGHRPYVFEVDLGVQHQLASRASTTAMFYHRWSGNHFAIANTAVTRADFTGPFCVTAPTSATEPKAALLPNGGGYQVCGLHDVNAPALGRIAELVTTADSLGSGVEQSNTGVTLTADVRLADAYLQGGLDLRRDLLDTCGIDEGDNPAGIRFPISGGAGIGAAVTEFDNLVYPDGSRSCDTNTGFRPDLKFSGSYQLPWGVMTSATYQNASGPAITSTWAATNAAIAPGLGRSLSAGATATKTVGLIQPDSLWGERLHQIDMRVSKRFALRNSVRFAVNADLFNVTNSNWIFRYTANFGPNFLRPAQVLSPRLFKISGQFDF
jgi:hypothetical protein